MEKSSESFNIVDLFYSSAHHQPDKTAIVYEGRPITFGELEQEVTATANYFLHKGIGKGDRVMVFIPMSLDLYRIVPALFRIGATAVFLDEWVGKKRMEACCRVAQCKALIGNYKATLLSLFSAELRKIPIKLGVAYKPTSATIPIPVTTVEDTALITFTTGSTGTPKAAKRTHGFLQAQFEALIQKTGNHANTIDMPVLPIVLLMNLGTGTTSVIANYKASKPDSLNPADIIHQLNQYQVTRIIASPFFIKQVALHIIKYGIELKHLQHIFTGGAPVFPAEAAIYARAFPSVAIEIVYGSTESEPISAIGVPQLVQEKDNILTQGLHVGKADPSAEVLVIKITDEAIAVTEQAALNALIVPNGTIGEIVVAGKHVLSAYYNNEAALKRNKIFIGGKCWHRTGDSGYVDDSGNIFLTGRCNTLLETGGKTIAPFIYENYFQTIDGIEMGTILLHRCQLTAVIELNTKSNKVLQAGITQRIMSLPIAFKQVLFLKKIPRDPRHHSKIDYQKLAMQLG